MKKEDAEIIAELREHGYTQPERTLRDIKRGLEDAKAGRVSKVKDRGLFPQYVEEVKVKKQEKLFCPECESEKLIKHGIRFAGKKGNRAKVQQYQCRDCGRITVKPVYVATKEEIEKMTKGKLPSK